MDTVRLTAMQRYYLEALGRQGRLRFGMEWSQAENRLAYCWYASGFAGRIEWHKVRHIVEQTWLRAATTGPGIGDRSSAARMGVRQAKAGGTFSSELH